jgi:hypothetical protein
VALVATAVVTVLNHAVRLALKATVVATVSKVVVIALKTAVHLHPVLKVVAILALRAVSNPVAISAANNAALRLAVAKAVSSPVAISALTTVVATASMHVTVATTAPLALQARQEAVTLVAAQVIALHLAAPRSLVQAISSHTMPAAMQHPSALAPKCSKSHAVNSPTPRPCSAGA